MCFVRFPSFVLLSAVASILTMSLASEGTAQGFYGRGYGYPARAYGGSVNRVPYRNDYHGYWRDQGYGFTGLRYTNRYGNRYGYPIQYGNGWYQGNRGVGPMYPNVKWHPRSKPGYPR